MMKLSDYVFDFVAGLGVRDVFLLPGGGSMHLVDSLGRNRNLRYVCCLHEQVAAIAAGAYGQYAGNIGVALVTTGPGGTNAVTGVAGAWTESSPLLVLSGQVKRADLIGQSRLRQMGVQEVDVVSVVGPITKYAVTVLDPSTIRYHLEKAVHLARTARPGPVWVDIPLDVQGALIDETGLRGFVPPPPPATGNPALLENQVTEALRLLGEAERPIILAGNGIRLAGAEAEFRTLVGLLGIPVLTTWRAIDLLHESHPLYFGRPGSIGQRGANFAQQNADCLLTLGARLDLGQVGFNHGYFARAAKKIVVDVDEAEVLKLKMTVDVPIVADAMVFIDGMLSRLGKWAGKDVSPWLSRCRSWKERYPVVRKEYRDQGKYVNTYVLVDVLSELMDENDVLVPGSSGSCSEVTLQAFKVKKGQRILNSPGLGAMGFGLPESIGACLASGGKRTITIIGDGGLQLNIQDLQTVARLRLPLKMFILNNQGYASIRNTQRNHFQGRLTGCDSTSGLTLPDTRRIAEAYRIPSCILHDHKDINDRVREVLDSPGPMICEVMTDPLQQTLPRLSSEVKPDGSIVSKPLEDLWPFLDREEFLSNMIIPPP